MPRSHLQLACLLLAALLAPAQARAQMLLADDAVTPSVRVQWTQASGETRTLEADLPWSSPEERTKLGDNLEAFVALGGSRLEKGAGHPAGAIARVGLFKTDRDLLMFEDIANGSDVTIELTGVAFNQPIAIDQDTLVQRLEYKVEDVEACGLTSDQTEMFNIVSDHDDMGGTILPRQTRYATFGQSESSEGDSEVWLEDDGTLSLRVVIPYRLLRHKGDPWALELPGSFFEPFHFDLEIQVLPYEVGLVEGVVEEPTG